MKKLLFAIFFVVFTAGAADPTAADLDALRQSAERGDADAQYELGILYEFGFRFPDYKTAAYVWYSRAAGQGHPAAARRRDGLKDQLSNAEWERAQAQLKVDAPTSVPASTLVPTAAR